MEKIVEVKKEVEYFNNYVYDPKRPQLPEHQTNKSGSSQQSSQYGSPNNQSGYKNQSMMYNSPGGSMLQSNMLGQMTGYSGGMQNRQVSGYGMQTGYMHDNMQQAGYGYNYGAGYSSGGYQMNRRGGYHMNRGYSGRGGRDSREMIQYKDLDAPEDN